MTDATVQPHDMASFPRDRPARAILAHILSGAVALALGGAMGAWMLHVEPRTAPVIAQTTPKRPGVAVPRRDVALFGPTFSLDVPPLSLGQSAPLGSALVPFSAPAAPFQVADAAPVAMNEPGTVAEAASPEPVAADPVSPSPDAGPIIPLPMPRPPDWREQADRPLLAPRGRQPARRVATAAPAVFDDRNFIQKLFGLGRPSSPALGYAAAEDDFPGRGLTSAIPPSASLLYDRWTAVYDIAAHTVYMPDGSRLEAHSGLGDRLDDPHHVDEPMRGATPPHVYELTPREQLFHGVQALRLTPVGGGGVFGRVGLLAHTYMLGPNGDSNGCVSFRNYNVFLQAFRSGEVKHLAVVARLS